MICDCGETMKLIRAGVSKSGKPYKAFYSCGACGITKNPEPQLINNKPNGVDPSMRLAYRKDLMCQVIEKTDNLATPAEIIDTFKILWTEVEK